MVNIFKNAYFGKAYKTRDGRKAIYAFEIHNGHYLIVDKINSLLGEYDDNGVLNASIYHNASFDIVSEWQFTDDEEVDKLAKEYAQEDTLCQGVKEGYSCPGLIKAFKAGCYKAKDNDPDPIPLSEEILEKNGMHYDEITEGWSKDGIVLYKYNDENRWWLSGYYDIIVIKYVHELQSLLLLAGIKDDLKI